VLSRLGARDVELLQAGRGKVSPPPTVIRVYAGLGARSKHGG
jgi:hypothetical protein